MNRAKTKKEPKKADPHVIRVGFYELGPVPDYRKDIGWDEVHVGFSKRIYCTEQFLRDLARKLWENKRDHGLTPYLAVHVKPAEGHKGGIIYEGAKPTGWQTGYSEELGRDLEYFCCDQNALCTDGKDHHFYRQFPIKDIVYIQVLT